MGQSAKQSADRQIVELERQLAESEKRLEQTQSLARVGSWEWSSLFEENWQSRWSPELKRIFGRDPAGPEPTREELVGAVHPEDRGEFEELVERVRTIPGPFEHSYRIVDGNGTLRYLEARGYVEGGPDGKPTRTFGTTNDVSDLRRSERDLRLRVAQQEAVALLGRRALAEVDPVALMEEAVDTVASVLRVELVEVLQLDESGRILRIEAGIGWKEGVVGQAFASDCEQMVDALAGGAAIVSDYLSEDRFAPVEVLRQHGARSGIAAAIDGGDRPYGVIGAHSTRVRRFSPDDAHFVQAVGNVLGAALARRRSRLIEARLQRAQRLEAIGQLAGGVAHDFNNILSVILNHAECLIDDGDEPGESLREIERAARSAAELTGQLLLFSRREPVELAPVDLVATVAETEAMLRRTIGEHVELAVELPTSLPPVSLGVGQAEQILVNLVVNARDAVTDGGRISAKARELEGGVVELRVEDDGAGMAPDVAAQAFDLFFTTKPRGKGTGLGLAAVHRIVSQAGGSVEIESEPGGGTAVAVRLPVAAGTMPAPARAQAVGSASGEGRTVLVVDNDDPVRKIVCRMVEKQGYAARGAASAAAAEELLHRSAPEVDLLLTDVLMPGMSGRELVERVRKRHPELRAIYMTGYTGDAGSPHGAWEEDVEVLQKPFTAQQLSQALAAALA